MNKRSALAVLATAFASASGTVTGLPTLVESPAGNWKLRVKDGQLLLAESKGLSLIIR